MLLHKSVIMIQIFLETNISAKKLFVSFFIKKETKLLNFFVKVGK